MINNDFHLQPTKTHPVFCHCSKAVENVIFIFYKHKMQQNHFNVSGKEIKFRTIESDDENRWLNFLDNCSQESIYSRFQAFFRYNSHEVAHRFCCLNNQKEIAIVAEVKEAEETIIIGVGRLIADPYHKNAEFAILIADNWQNKEIGSHLTNYCIEIAKQWEIEKLQVFTSSDNLRIIKMFKKRGFQVFYDHTIADVVLEKEL